MKELLKEHFDKLFNRCIDYIFNNLMAVTTLLGITGFIVHRYYPTHEPEYLTFIQTYLIHQRKANS